MSTEQKPDWADEVTNILHNYIGGLDEWPNSLKHRAAGIIRLAHAKSQPPVPASVSDVAEKIAKHVLKELGETVNWDDYTKAAQDSFTGPIEQLILPLVQQKDEALKMAKAELASAKHCLSNEDADGIDRCIDNALNAIRTVLPQEEGMGE